jgi:hypothetical protein
MTQATTDITADQWWGLYRAYSRKTAPLRDEVDSRIAAVIAERDALGIGYSKNAGYQDKWRAYQVAYNAWLKAASVQSAIGDLWEEAAIREKQLPVAV